MPGRPSDTSAARPASGPATPTTRSGHANAPRATAPPGQFRKLDALAVLTGPLLPAPPLHITSNAVTCALNLRSHHPVLIDAGFADLEVPIPWWDGHTLRFRFPPR